MRQRCECGTTSTNLCGTCEGRVDGWRWPLLSQLSRFVSRLGNSQCRYWGHDELLHGLTYFPAAKHDDQVDAFGLIGRMLDEMVAASVPKAKPQKPAKDAYTRAVRETDGYRTV
jgi:hypothetical protein